MVPAEMQAHMPEQLREIRDVWHAVPTPRGRTRSEIIEWLEANITGRYYWDDVNITDTIRKVYLENADDLVFYRMVWEEYL